MSLLGMLGSAIGGGGGGGLLSAGASLIGGGSRSRKQYHRQKKLMGFQREHQELLNQQGHDLQMDLWNKTNYKAQLEQMKKAGLNPALMYGSAGQGGSTAGSSGGSAAGGNAPVETSMDISSMLMARQLEKLKAEVDLDKERSKTEVSKQEDYKSIINERDGVKREDYKASIGFKKVQSENFRLKNLYYSREIESALKLQGQQIANLKQDYRLKEEQWEGLINEAIGNGLSALNNSELINAKTRLTETEEKAVFEKLNILWNEIELKGEELGLKSRALDYDEIRTMVEKEFRRLDLDQKIEAMWINNGTKILQELTRGWFSVAVQGMKNIDK